MERIDELCRRFEAETLAQSLGAGLDLPVAGSAWVCARVREEFLNCLGFVQGGIITALVDFAGAYAAMSVLPDGETPTSRLTISFLRPFRLGETIRASAVVVSRTRRRLLVRVDVFSDDESLRARATVSFAQLRH